MARTDDELRHPLTGGENGESRRRSRIAHRPLPIYEDNDTDY